MLALTWGSGQHIWIQSLSFYILSIFHPRQKAAEHKGQHRGLVKVLGL
jgi:hypothetical protein